MANCVIDDNRHRFMIIPVNMGERSALLKLASKKWMQSTGLFLVPQSRANAKHLIDEYNARHIQFDTAMLEKLERLVAVTHSDRVFPDWYTFNNSLGPPMEHQREALAKLYPVDAGGMFMEMGTAKTRVCIDMMTAHFYEARIQFAVVVCPLTVKVATWVQELENFSPCLYKFVSVDSGFDWTAYQKLDPKFMYWFVVGVESLSQGKTFKALLPLLQQKTARYKYGMAVDESSRISNHKAICTQACIELGRNAQIRVVMTGSEVKKDIIDLYSQFEFLDPNIIGVGDYFAFRNRYCMMGGYKRKEIIGYDNMDELMGLISPHVYECDKAKVLKDLPPKVYEQRMVQMAPEQKVMYAKVKRAELEGFSLANVLTRTLRLQQVAAGYLRTDATKFDHKTQKRIKVPVTTHEIVPPSKNPKLQELMRVCDETKHPMIIWGSSMYEIDILVATLSKRGEVIRFTGETPQEERKYWIDLFQKGNTPYFVGTAAAGGIGTTLTAARTMVFFTNTPRFVDRVQAEDRAHRKGQKNSVLYIDLLCEKTVDIGLRKNLQDKQDLATYLKSLLRDKLRLNKFFDGVAVESSIRTEDMVYSNSEIQDTEDMRDPTYEE